MNKTTEEYFYCTKEELIDLLLLKDEQIKKLQKEKAYNLGRRLSPSELLEIIKELEFEILELTAGQVEENKQLREKIEMIKTCALDAPLLFKEILRLLAK